MFCTVIEGQGKGAYFVEGSKKELEPYLIFHFVLSMINWPLEVFLLKSIYE